MRKIANLYVIQNAPLVSTASSQQKAILKESPEDHKDIRDNPGADPGFFLGGGALVSCSTSTLINHIVFFFAEYQLY